jgi:hypothetical protein
MMLFDHGMPRADGTVSKEQRPEADINIEFQSRAKMADEAQKLAWTFYAANEAFASDYPAAVGPHMTNTDSTPFMDRAAAISVRENERGREMCRANLARCARALERGVVGPLSRR